MRKYKILIILVFTLSITSAQEISKLNGFSHFRIVPFEYKNGNIDIYRMMPEIKNTLVKKGLKYWYQNTQWPDQNPCQIVTCLIEQNGVVRSSNSTNAKVRVAFYDCNSEIIFQTDYKGGSWIFSSLSNYFQKAIKKTLKPIRKFKYKFNSDLTPKLDLPDVETTTETEKSLMEYFDSNTLDNLEGIYKSYNSETYYKFGIKKFGSKYKAIILEAEPRHWKVGEVKAIFEPSSVEEIFSVNYFMGDKSNYETFGTLENGGLLTIEIMNNQTKEKDQSKFFKLYPTFSNKINKKKSINSISATGSGFIINKNGIIATNAHVVENADRIEITIKDDIGEKKYSAKVLIKDDNNDVALLKIEDSNFLSFNNLPYMLLENTEIGESVFTIGFPLNSIMGNNFKVNNGIVSSNTGISDDIRHYQISVPLQPGNSGGPLFNENGDIIGITSSRLNEKAIGTSVQNVNYAIKSAYILNLIKMLPDFDKPIGNLSLQGKNLKEKIKILKNYVCLIRVY
ncbi:S1C family serine protease [bacterium]|nr:S1C family serine protease [bacterium]